MRKGGMTMRVVEMWLAAVCILVSTAYAARAQGVMEFAEKTYSFEQIPEDGGTVTHTFTFRNTGNAPVVIKQVSSSCGCTVSDWSKEPVLPGKDGFVSGTYNPMGRPGSFTKSLTVVSNAEPSREVLYLTGTVVPRARSKQEQYPYHMGPVWASASFLSLPRVLHDGTTRGTLGLYNSSNREVEVKFAPPKSVKLADRRLVLAPGVEQRVEVVVDGHEVEDWGYTTEKFSCEVLGEEYTVELGFSRDENFGAWSEEQRLRAPLAEVKLREIDFGAVRSGDVLRASFELTNVGQSALYIRRVQTNCSCLQAAVGKEKLRPKARTKVNVAFNTEGLRGVHEKDVTLITNDPQQRYVRLRVKANVR